MYLLKSARPRWTEPSEMYLNQQPLVFSKSEAVRGIYGRCAERHVLLGFLVGCIARVDKELVHIQGLFPLGHRHYVRRQEVDDAPDGSLRRQQPDLRSREHSGVNAAQRGKAESAALIARHDESHLVHVGVQHDRGSAGDTAAAYCHKVAQHIRIHAVSHRLQQGLCRGSGVVFEAGGPVFPGQQHDDLSYVHVFYSISMTMRRKVFPRSSKFLNLSKDAQAGESSTISPGSAALEAARTVSRKSSMIWIFSFSGS